MELKELKTSAEKHIKEITFWLLKLFAAGVISFLIMNTIVFFYNNPATRVRSISGATDSTWEPYSVSSLATEGFARVTYDANGYNNSWVSDSDDINILCMGSSHSNAANVAQTENYVYDLNSLLLESGVKWYAYDIGMNGHSFHKVAANLGRAVNAYKPSDYVVMEIEALTYSVEDIEKILNDDVEYLTAYNDNKQLYYMQKVPYLRHMYHQLDSLGVIGGGEEPKIKTSRNVDVLAYSKILNELMAAMANTVKSANCKLIIVYHPHMLLQENGSVTPDIDWDYFYTFKEACANNGIIFLDMSEAFIAEYKTNYVLPHGFSNSAVGVGHLNQYGHKVIAVELYKTITGGETE